MLKFVSTGTLNIGYEENGPTNGDPVLLMHGWPYDPRTYDGVVAKLTAASCRTFVPYLRGFGPTRFLSTGTPRSGQQAALGSDLKDFMERSGCSAPRSSAMIGAGAPPASWRRCGPNAHGASSPATATTSRTFQTRTRRPRPSRSCAIGISIISTPNAARQGWRQTGVN